MVCTREVRKILGATQRVTGMELKERLYRIERLNAMQATDTWSVEDVAILLNKSVSRIYSMTSAKEIPHYKKGATIVFKRAEIEAWRTGTRIATNDELRAEAINYTATGKHK